jgi:multisubunit Na+/H+ antiporter MnhG subunit
MLVAIFWLVLALLLALLAMVGIVPMPPFYVRTLSLIIGVCIAAWIAAWVFVLFLRWPF